MGTSKKNDKPYIVCNIFYKCRKKEIVLLILREQKCMRNYNVHVLSNYLSENEDMLFFKQEPAKYLTL